MEKQMCKHMSLSLVWLTTKYQTETGEWSENKYRTKKKGEIVKWHFRVTRLNTYKLARRRETQMCRLKCNGNVFLQVNEVISQGLLG